LPLVAKLRMGLWIRMKGRTEWLQTVGTMSPLETKLPLGSKVPRLICDWTEQLQCQNGEHKKIIYTFLERNDLKFLEQRFSTFYNKMVGTVCNKMVGTVCIQMVGTVYIKMVGTF
jgi:hypothetical protein